MAADCQRKHCEYVSLLSTGAAFQQKRDSSLALRMTLDRCHSECCASFAAFASPDPSFRPFGFAQDKLQPESRCGLGQTLREIVRVIAA
jgi:hypothetical protein